jgi:hypothetical protein
MKAKHANAVMFEVAPFFYKSSHSKRFSSPEDQVYKLIDWMANLGYRPAPCDDLREYLLSDLQSDIELQRHNRRYFFTDTRTLAEQSKIRAKN